MSDKKISQLTAATTPLAGTEVLPIVQGTTTVKVANNDLRPKQIQSNATSGVLQVTGPAAATTRVMTTPDANFTVACTDAGQTFTGNQEINGNVGVQVTPSTWSTGSVVEVGAAGNSIWGYSGVTRLTQNAYFNSGYKYGANGAAAAYALDSGNHVWSVAASGSTGGAITFTTGMQMHNSGGVSIGNTTDPGAGSLNVNNTIKIGSATNINSAYLQITNNNSDDHVQVRNPSATAGKYWSMPYLDSGNKFHIINGSAVGVAIADGAQAWSAFSDIRLKNVIGTYENPLEDIAQIQPIKFTLKDDPTNSVKVGVSAQSVENVVPEAIEKSVLPKSDDTTEYLTVRYTELIPLLIASVQALSNKVTALENRVATLESK